MQIEAVKPGLRVGRFVPKNLSERPDQFNLLHRKLWRQDRDGALGRIREYAHGMLDFSRRVRSGRLYQFDPKRVLFRRQAQVFFVPLRVHAFQSANRDRQWDRAGGGTVGNINNDDKIRLKGNFGYFTVSGDAVSAFLRKTQVELAPVVHGLRHPQDSSGAPKNDSLK